MNTVTPRSPQFFKSSSSNPNSDEILNSIPQRPPRHNRLRSDSTSSPTLSSAQYYHHFQPHQPQHSPHPHDSYYAASNHSPRPSPRSTPNAYNTNYPSQPASPMTFQLPPSALSVREDSLRSGSIPFSHSGYAPSSNHSNHGAESSASSYRSPHVSPGLPSNGMMPVMPPLSLPEAFLEEQSDYAGYYSDVGMLSSPQMVPDLHIQPLQTETLQPRQQQPQQHSTSDPLSPLRLGRSGAMFLPSPHMTPTASPLSGDFPNLSIDSRPQNTQGRSRAHSASHSTVSSIEESLISRNSLIPRSSVDPNSQENGFYKGQPHVPVESFLMPTQEQYPPDALILFGGSASHSEGSLFRKDAKEYLILTNSSLLKYKTMEKAAKVFGNQSVWSSSSGHQLLTPTQTSLITKDHRLLSLNSIVGVHTIQPIGSDNQIVIEYLVSISSSPSTMHFTPAPDQIESWLKELRQGCNYHANQAGVIPKGTRQRQWVLDKLQEDHIALPSSVAENDPTALAAGGMWRAYFKLQKIRGVPAQENGPLVDPKVPLEGKVVVIAIGASYIHILPHNLGNGSTKEDMKDERTILAYPILTVRAIQYKEKDDTFSISFGTTLRQRTVMMTFVSARAREIIIAIRARVESLRWLYPLGRKGVELALSEDLARPIPVPSKEYMADLGFEDLLRAECNAMGVDRKVYGNVKMHGFVLKIGKPNDSKADTTRDFSVDEMKCLLRALRFNTTFKEISFRDVSFANLQKPKTLKDGTLRYGLRLDQEFYELLMGNPEIRSLDLHNCKLDTSTIGSLGRAIRDGYASGLRLEGLDLYGNNATDGADVMTLAKGIVKHAGTLHNLDVGKCQITGDGINQIMHAFVANPDVASHTLESFGIHANADSKVNSYILDMFLKHSMRLESLNLSKLTSWSKSPILMAETLSNCGGFLRILDLSGMAIHPTTLDQLISWITSSGFDSLQQLKVEGCGLDGLQFGSILEAIGQSGNRNVEVLAGRNLLSDGNDLSESLVTILASGDTTTSLGLRQTCWSEQALRQLFSSLGQNDSLKKLDLSSVSLASSRDPDVETCKLLGDMISSSDSRLEELYVQGEETAELTSRMGRNLWRAFQGLGNSRYLTKLDVSRNRFRDEGALALAEALRVNQSLTWLEMDENDVSMDGYNAILSAFYQGGTEQVPASSRCYNSTLCHFGSPIKDVSLQTNALRESMLETYKTEQEIRFLLSNSTGKDAKEWKERLAQIIRTRNSSADAISRLERAVTGIAAMVDRNKAAMDAVIRDRERRRERDQDRERQLQRDQERNRDRR